MTNPNMHTEFIREDGETVEPEYDLAVATYYAPCVGILNADGYLRVIADAPGHHTETRVDHATLIAAGWTPPAADHDLDSENAALRHPGSTPQDTDEK